jgi:small multidrug resistance pump
MSESILPILIVVLLSLAGVLGDVFLKLSGNTDKFIDLKTFLIGSAIYASTVFGWFYVMKHIRLSMIGVIYSMTTIITLVIVGLFYFEESMNLYEVLGVMTAILSLFLLSRVA